MKSKKVEKNFMPMQDDVANVYSKNGNIYFQILVTGTAGFIGFHLCVKLLERRA